MLETISSGLMEHGGVFFIGSIRPIVFFTFAPFLAGHSVPGQLRFSLGMLIALFAFPAFGGLRPPVGETEFFLWTLCVLGKEVLSGFILAYSAGIVFWAMLSVGFIMDNQRGAGMAQAEDPISGESSSPMGGFLNQIATYIFFSSGAFAQVIVFLLASYTTCPPGFDLGTGAREGIPFFLLGQFSRLMVMAIVFSAPIVLICLLSDISLGIVNRFAPQLNVFFLSMPIKSALGLFMIMLYLGELMPLVTRELFSIGMYMDAFWGVARVGEASL